MPALKERLEILCSRYANLDIDRESFAEEFADLYFEARRSTSDPVVNRICSRLVGPFAELSRGHRSEGSFRAIVAQEIRDLADENDIGVVSVRMDLLYPGLKLNQPFEGIGPYSAGLSRPAAIRIEA